MDVNVDRMGPISVEEIEPYTITFQRIPVQAGNTITKAVRIDRMVAGDSGVDISTLVEIDDNKALVRNIFLPDETPTAGNYCIKVVMMDPISVVVKDEHNTYIQVL